MPRDHLAPPEAEIPPARLLVLACAVACGAGAANLYYSQPLVGLIGPELRLSPSASSLIVTLTQLGYTAGLFLLVPLGDLLENRRLIAITMGTAVVALIGASLTQSAPAFLAASLMVGVTSAAVQMLVPFAASLAPLAMRGRVVGNVMSGLITGILLARPAASLGSELFGWRGVFVAAALLTAGMAVLLWYVLPRRYPGGASHYVGLLASLWPLFRQTRILRQRCLYQAFLFGTFALFWTATPLLLAGAGFHLRQTGIALFALAGAGGAFAAPIAGRLADAGHSRLGTGAAMALVGASFALAGLAAEMGALWLLVLAGVLLDCGVQANQVFSQRALYALAAETRSRLNGVYIGLFFVGGAVGSALAGPALVHGGYWAVAGLGVLFPALALLFYARDLARA